MTELPLLDPCSVCGLAVESGRGPGGRAWHDCTAVLELRTRVSKAAEVVTDDDLVHSLKQTIKARAAEFPAKDLAMLLQALQGTPGGGDVQAPSGGSTVTGAFLAFTRPE